MQLPPEPTAGQPLSALWGKMVVACLRAGRIRSGPGIRATESPDGTVLSSTPARLSPRSPFVLSLLEPFEIADPTSTTFSVMDNLGRTRTVLSGARATIAAGAGFTFDTDRWVSGTLDGARWVYLDYTRSTTGATIVLSTTAPGVENQEVYVDLYYIAWDTDHIDWDVSVNLRKLPRVPATE